MTTWKGCEKYLWSFVHILQGKVIFVTGRGGPWDCETARVEVPAFCRQSAHRWRCQPYVPFAIYSSEESWYSFLLEVKSTPGP
jgi:hypothetical protein